MISQSTVCLVITENKVLEIEFYSWNFFCFNAIVEMYYVLCIMYYVFEKELRNRH